MTLPGPGGGGGGGFIWSNAALPLNVTTNVSGGAAGFIKDSPTNPPCELTSNGAAAGGNGSSANNFTITEGTVLSCAALPIPSLTDWYGKKINEGVLLEWKLSETNSVDEVVLEKKTASGIFYVLKKYSNPVDGFYTYTDYTTSFPASYRLMIKDLPGKKE
ncbi:MAG: hypothetical protein K2X48_06485 [Chitinophagaceae bacterium]|nr:hypothetical protein [Chitinophagaceae bacterium]